MRARGVALGAEFRGKGVHVYLGCVSEALEFQELKSRSMLTKHSQTGSQYDAQVSLNLLDGGNDGRVATLRLLPHSRPIADPPTSTSALMPQGTLKWLVATLSSLVLR